MKPAIVALGPTSCVLNALPLAKAMSEAGGKPAFAVAEEFKSVLESVSYVEPVFVPGGYEHLRTAMDNLARTYKIIQMQVKGHGYMVPKPVGQSHNEEAYALAGFHQRFCNGEYETLLLDQRFPEEEEEIVNRLVGEDKRPVILINLTEAAGSAFTFSSQVLELVASRFAEECLIINLEGMKLKRVGNLLGLFERASFLITADNATLHLAAACPTLPYIAFIAGTPTLWNGSYTRGNCVLRIRYDQYTYWPFAITKLIERAIKRPDYPWRLVHAYHIAPNVGYDSWRRNKNAERTWKALRVLGWIDDVGVRLEDLPRTFPDGDRQMAYTKDMIDAGFAKCKMEGKEAIMLCNTDTCFDMDMYDNIVKVMETGVDGFCGPRRDFMRIEEALYPSQVVQGRDYCGTDIFVFTPQWWKKNRDSFPDMVHGTEAWDCIMRWQMVHRDKLPMVNNLIYHERHASRWEQRQNINSLPSQRHNIGLAIQALEELNKVDPTKPLWRDGMFGISRQRLGMPAYPQQRTHPQAPQARPAMQPPGPGRQLVHPAIRRRP